MKKKFRYAKCQFLAAYRLLSLFAVSSITTPGNTLYSLTTQQEIPTALAHLSEQSFSAFKFKIDKDMHRCKKPVSNIRFSKSMALKMAKMNIDVDH